MMRTCLRHAAFGLLALALMLGACGKKAPQAKSASKPSPMALASAPLATPTPAAGWALKAADAAKVVVIRAQSLPPSASAAEYPLRCEVSAGPCASPDGKRSLRRGLGPQGYQLFLTEQGRERPLPGTHNAYLPQWSPDGKKLCYTAMDWKRHLRSVQVYDLASLKGHSCFKAKHQLGGFACFSPDGGKIIFTYRGQAWIMNANGVGLSMLRLDAPISEARAFGFSQDGMTIAILAAAPAQARGQLLTLAIRP